MYKHECVKCSKEHVHRCIWNIGFIDRFFGTDKVKYCITYNEILKYQKHHNRKVKN